MIEIDILINIYEHKGAKVKNLELYMNDIINPISIVFIVISLGLMLGFIKIGRVKLGIAGVLGSALILGMIMGKSPYFLINDQRIYIFIQSDLELYSFLSNLGMSIFIAIISIQTGNSLNKNHIRDKTKSFLGGILIVLIGGVVALFFIACDYDSRLTWIGSFAGGMTSTPTLAAALELFNDNASIVSGYATSYCFGLYSIVLFVQLMIKNPETTTPKRREEKSKKALSNTYSFLFISIVIVLGIVLGNIKITNVKIGTSLGIMLFGIAGGWFVSKLNIKVSNMSDIKNLGLMMFFVGTGIPAGINFNQSLNLGNIVAGILIPVISIFCGYFALRKALSFSKLEALTVLCGGMTSTPAICLLQEKENNVELQLYTFAYSGALLTSMVFVKVLSTII